MRTEILLNENWRFFRGDIPVPTPATKGPVYAQSKTERKLEGPASYFHLDRPDPQYLSGRETGSKGWQKVDLPHDYVILQDNCEKENNALGYFHYDNAWYRKHFTMPEDSEGKRVLLRFDGIAGVSTIYLNGCLMHHNFSAYNTFEVDISSNVYFDKENVLAIYINREEFEGWWYQGGGIYRNVHLVITEPCAIDLWGVYAPYDKLDDHSWQINFETTVINDYYEAAQVAVKSAVYDADGNCVAEAEGQGRVDARDKTVLTYSCIVKDPLLWDCDNPNLYTIRTQLWQNDQQIDENTTRIGFRTMELSTEKGLLLNGKKIIVKGLCAHQDFGLTGLVVPPNVAKYKIKLMKEMGANGYRTAHYQQTESYMDALDELGFVVMAEARWFEYTKEAIDQLESLVKRDRNRPSVFFWSTGNEEYYHVTDVGQRLHRAIAAHIRKLDKYRAITAAVDRTPDKCMIYKDCDIVGINYKLPTYDAVHENHPDKLIIASECCAVPTVRDWHFATNNNGRARDIDNEDYWPNSRERTWKHLMERPYTVGGYQWGAVEHRGEAAWPMICSKSGVIDLFLQKKGGFYHNKSYWTEEPMVHLTTHWNFEGLEGAERIVPVYTNCDEVELLLNGTSLGRKQIEKYSYGVWKFPYAPGQLVANGYRQGKLVCTDRRETVGKPVSLRLTALDAPFKADGLDMALFLCQCLDEQGREVPTAAEFVEFVADSGAQVVATGSDNCDHNRVNLPYRQMYMGRILIGVKPAKDQPHFTLTAMSKNCGMTYITV